MHDDTATSCMSNIVHDKCQGIQKAGAAQHWRRQRSAHRYAPPLAGSAFRPCLRALHLLRLQGKTENAGQAALTIIRPLPLRCAFSKRTPLCKLGCNQATMHHARAHTHRLPKTATRLVPMQTRHCGNFGKLRPRTLASHMPGAPTGLRQG